FNFPRGVAVDAQGNVYVSDNSNSVIRVLKPQVLPPAINTNGVISADAFGVYPTSAPGAWVEIYGLNLALTTRNWFDSDFNGTSAPTTLDGVSVTVDGQPAYLSYISPGQVNALIPSTVTAGAKSLVLKNAIGSNTYTIQLNAIQ